MSNHQFIKYKVPETATQLIGDDSRTPARLAAAEQYTPQLTRMSQAVHAGMRAIDELKFFELGDLREDTHRTKALRYGQALLHLGVHDQLKADEREYFMDKGIYAPMVGIHWVIYSGGLSELYHGAREHPDALVTVYRGSKRLEFEAGELVLRPFQAMAIAGAADETAGIN